MYYWHGLTPDWYTLPYEAFLEQRERLIAKVIKDGFYRIAAAGNGAVEGTPHLAALLQAGEGSKIEYKSTLRVNLITGQPDHKVEHSVLKTIAAFMNSEGGQLVIGVEDTGKVLGIAADAFPNEDKMTLHLVNLVKTRLGAQNMMFVDSRYEAADGKKVLILSCRPASKPVFVQDGGFERFYVRTLASTTELMGSHAQHYIEQRF
jgi:predicted HTH transcriptional regulator